MSHAEVSEVWPRDGRIVIRGTIISPNAGSAAGWRLRMVSREREQQQPGRRKRALDRVRALAHRSPRFPAVITLPVSVEQTKFEAVIGLQTLAPSEPLPRELWDLYLVPSENKGSALRLGRHLDDMPGKKNIVVFPKQRVDEPGRLSIRPYYTDGDHLAIRCLRSGEEQ